MVKIFASYAYSDFHHSFLNKLNQGILRIGYELVSPSNQAIQSGQSIQEQTHKMIDECPLMVAFLTDPYSNVFLELGYALGRDKRLLLFIKPNMQIPPFLYDINYISTSMDIESLLPILLMSLRKLSHDKSFYLDQSFHLKSADLKNTHLKNISWHYSHKNENQLKSIIAKWYRKKGFNIEDLALSKDKGFDLLVFNPKLKRTIFIEIKTRSPNSKVNIDDIVKHYERLNCEGGDFGEIYSTSGFTESAISISKELDGKIILKTLKDIEKMELSI